MATKYVVVKGTHKSECVAPEVTRRGWGGEEERGERREEKRGKIREERRDQYQLNVVLTKCDSQSAGCTHKALA